MLRTEVSSKDKVFYLDRLAFGRCQVISENIRSVQLSSRSEKERRLPYSSWNHGLDMCHESSDTTTRQEAPQLTGVFDQTVNGWISYIKEQFYAVPQVEAIYVAIDENNIDVWLLIPRRDFALLGQLIDIEMKIMEKFITAQEPLLLFEFHIIYRSDASENQLMPRHALRLTR